MSGNARGLIVAVAALFVAACSSTSTAGTISPAPSVAASPTIGASPSAAAATTSMDPCQLVTQAEASQLAGTSYAAGKEETTSGGGRMCWYGAQTTNVFEVFVGAASSAGVAQAQWDNEKSQLQAAIEKGGSTPGLTLNANVVDTSIAGADRAAAGSLSFSGNGFSIAGSVVYLLKGATFVAIANLVAGHASPSIPAMEAEAQIALGRLP